MRIIRTALFLLVGGLFFLVACGTPADETSPTATQAPTATSTAGFTTSNLTVTPDTAKPGERVMVGVTVTNNGAEQGSYTVVVKLHDGTVVETKDVTLAGGAKENVTLHVAMNTTGTHMIMIDKLYQNLLIQDAAVTTPPNQSPPPPPVTGQTGFVLSNMGLDPEMPDVGEDVTVSVKVTNTGGQQGTYKVVVKLDDVIAGTQDVNLAAGASQVVNVHIKAPSKEGTFTVTVGNQKRSMIVMGM